MKLQTASRLLLLACLDISSPTAGSRVLPPLDQRVDFSQHGSDWTQGQCGTRDFQSPINLNALFMPASGTFSYFYREVNGMNLTMNNDGRSLMIDLTGKGFGSVILPEAFGSSTPYNLKGIVIHGESEHTLRGEHTPLEIQLVHQASNVLDATAGKELVVISILVSSPNPPTAKAIWPGLLQTRRPEPRLRRASKVNSLLQATDAGQAPAPAASPSAAPEAVDYIPPPLGAPGFNPHLQFLVDQEPPVLDDEVTISLPPMRPMSLNNLMAGGTYFTYKGSETLPPCDERVVWLVRREKVIASDAQVEALFSQIYKTSSGAGFYRTIMPINRREIGVVAGKVGVAPPPPPAANAGGTFGLSAAPPDPSVPIAQDAIIIAKATADYAKDLDMRLRAAANAHLKSLLAPPPTTPMPLMMGGTTTEPEIVPPAPLDQQWVASKMTAVVKQAIKEEIAAAIKDVAPAAASLAKSYLRKDLMTRAGFHIVAPPTLAPWQLHPTAPPLLDAAEAHAAAVAATGR